MFVILPSQKFYVSPESLPFTVDYCGVDDFGFLISRTSGKGLVFELLRVPRSDQPQSV